MKGGAIYVSGSSAKATVIQCTFEKNSAGYVSPLHEPLAYSDKENFSGFVLYILPPDMEHLQLQWHGSTAAFNFPGWAWNFSMG